MKQCPVCKQPIMPDAPFCPQCGTAMMVMKPTDLLTGQKWLDVLAGIAISGALLFGLGLVASFLVTYAHLPFLTWVLMPIVGNIVAIVAAFLRRRRFVAYGLMIPLLLLLLIILGVFLLCSGFKG